MRYTIKNIFNKTNVPYLIAGALATATLLASGVFAAAPYIGFLAPVAALSVGLPFIIGGAVFSAVAIALSYKAISKNKTISEKDVQLANQAKEIEGKDKTVSEKETQLAEKDAEVQAQKQTISEKDAQLASQAKEIEGKDKIISEKEATVQAQKQTISEKDAQLSEKEKEIEELKRGNAFVPQENIVGSTKNAYGTSVEYVKGKFNNAGNKLKNFYDTSVEYTKGALNSVGSSGSSLYSRLYGTKVSSPEEQFKCEDGSKTSMQELTRLDCDGSSQLAGDEEDIFYDAEFGDEKDTEISSLKEQLDENSKAKVPSRISDLCESVKGKFTSFWSGVQSIYSKNVYNSCALGTNLLHAQHTSTLANVPQEEVINKEAQKPEEQADQKPNLQRDNSINNTEEGGKNKRSGSARRKRKQAQVEQPIVYTVRTSNKYDLLSSECFLG